MKYLRKFNSVDDANGQVVITPNTCLVDSIIHIKGKEIASYATFEESLNGDLKEMNFKAELTCSEDTTLPVWFTEEEYMNGTPSETLTLTAGENTVSYPHSIFRMGIITYDPTTKARNGGNNKITSLKLYGVWKDGYRMFDNGSGGHALTSLDLTHLDTSEMTSLFCAFQGSNNITTIGDISNWDVSNVTDMSSMFSGINDPMQLSNIGDLSKWNVSKVTSMRNMFLHCSNITSLGDISKWNTSNVTSTYCMFESCSGLTSLDLSKWNVSKVTTTRSMFYSCPNLTSVGDLSKWDVSNVTTFQSMFYSCPNLTSVGDLSKWDVSNVTTFQNMFYSCPNLTSVGDLSKWDVSNVTTFQSMFGCCPNITTLGDLSKWNVSKVTSTRNMFGQSSYIGDGTLTDEFVATLANWDTSNITDMTCMFYGQAQITTYPFENWNTSKCTSFNHMFADNFKLQIIDMTNWDTSSLETCYNMLNDCRSLTTIGNIGNWNVENLIDCGSFLTRCESLSGKIDLSGWYTPKLRGCAYMFTDCSGIVEVDIRKMVTSGVNSTAWEGAGSGIHYAYDDDCPTMNGMFNGCTNLTTITVGSGWDTSNTTTTNMFTNCGTDQVTVV